MEPLPGSTRSTVHTGGTSNFSASTPTAGLGLLTLAGDANGLYTKLQADTVLEGAAESTQAPRCL